MDQRVCKNKKCKKPLPDGYKHKYCESCRNNQAKQFKDASKAVLSLAVMVGGTAISIATKGKINPGKK